MHGPDAAAGGALVGTADADAPACVHAARAKATTISQARFGIRSSDVSDGDPSAGAQAHTTKGVVVARFVPS